MSASVNIPELSGTVTTSETSLPVSATIPFVPPPVPPPVPSLAAPLPEHAHSSENASTKTIIYAKSLLVLFMVKLLSPKPIVG